MYNVNRDQAPKYYSLAILSAPSLKQQHGPVCAVGKLQTTVYRGSGPFRTLDRQHRTSYHNPITFALYLLWAFLYEN